MNQMKYANFPTLLSTAATSNGVNKKHFSSDIISGMYKITILTKEGFAGLNKLNEENQDLEFDTRQAVNRALQENPILLPRDEDYLREVREYVRSEVSGMFHR